MLYDSIGKNYQDFRRPDPRIGDLINQEIGAAARIVNLGAGTGSYEPAGRGVVAVEPSWTMIRQRGHDLAPVVRAEAEHLPFRDNAFEVATAILTIHHWSDINRGLVEMRRVAKSRVVLLTWIGFVQHFWLLDYLPQIKQTDEPLFPSIKRIGDALGGDIRVIPAPIPRDCTDGFLCAYWGRPERYLDKATRDAISTFSRIKDSSGGLDRLRRDLASGRWHEKYRELQEKQSMDHGYRIVVCNL